MTGITIATALGGIATKQCHQTSNGPIWTDYPNEKWWRLRELPTPSDADGWATFLQDRVDDFTSCCLYGQPVNEGAGRQRRLLHPTDGDPVTLREVPRDYLILDIDSVPTLTGVNFLNAPAIAVGAVIDTVEELSGCAAAVAVSCSAGFKDGIRAKAVVPLCEPLLPSSMRRWARAVNARFKTKILDPVVLAPAQPIYLARPIFYGVSDPFPQRVFVREGWEPVTLTIPSEMPGASPLAGGAIGARGWRTHLTRLGPLGFHDALLAAAGAVVHSYRGAPPEPIATAIHDIVREAVLRAEAGPRGPEEIARYASRRFWDDAIAHAARRETDHIRRIAASVAGIRRV